VELLDALLEHGRLMAERYPDPTDLTA